MLFARCRGLVLLAAMLSVQAQAADTVLSFVGTCQNSLCSASGADGSTPATVLARITLSDLTWVASGTGFEASFTDVKDFAYTGPKAFALAATSDVVADQSVLFSTTASVDGIRDFDITYAGGSAYFAGDATGWGLGIYFPLVVGGVIVPTPLNVESSTLAGQWRVSAVPEPAALGLLCAGLGLLGWRGRGQRPLGVRLVG